MDITDPQQSNSMYLILLVLEEIRKQLNERKSLLNLGRTFRIFDDNGNRKIDKQEFYWGLNELGCKISKRNAEVRPPFLMPLAGSARVPRQGRRRIRELRRVSPCNQSKQRSVIVTRAAQPADVRR